MAQYRFSAQLTITLESMLVHKMSDYYNNLPPSYIQAILTVDIRGKKKLSPCCRIEKVRLLGRIGDIFPSFDAISKFQKIMKKIFKSLLQSLNLTKILV